MQEANEDVVERLISEFWNGTSKESRINVAFKLGELGNERAIQALIFMLDYPSEIESYEREAIEEALIKLGRPAMLTLINGLIQEEHDRYGGSVVALSKFGEPALLELLELFKDKNIYRPNIAFALGWTKDKRAIAPLIKALNEEDYEVRGESAIALGIIGDTQAIEPLIQTLNHKEARVRWKAAVALGELKARQAIDSLILALSDEDYSVRWMAAEALGRIKDKRAVEPLIQLAKDEAEIVRRSAFLALSEIGDIRAVKPLINALKDQNEDQKLHDALNYSAFPQMGAIVVLPLVEVLKDENKDGQRRAIFALGEIGDKRATEPLLEILKNDTDEWTSTWIAIALGKIRDQRAVEPLIELLKDKSPYLRADAAKALGLIEDRKALSALIEMKENDVAEIWHKKLKEIAAEAIESIERSEAAKE